MGIFKPFLEKIKKSHDQATVIGAILVLFGDDPETLKVEPKTKKDWAQFMGLAFKKWLGLNTAEVKDEYESAVRKIVQDYKIETAKIIKTALKQ